MLYETLSGIADVTVVAPLVERSTTGHTLSLDDHIRIEHVEDKVYGCSGYPADASHMGFSYILKDETPDLVISGINRGANLGQDVYYSGTVAAAREATFHNIPSIAVSLDLDFKSKIPYCHFETAANFIAKILSLDLAENMDSQTLLNINVPNVKEEEIEGFTITNLGERYYTQDIMTRVDSRGRDYHWIGGVYNGFNEALENSDCLAVSENKISISPIDLLNKYDDLKPKWQKIFQAI